MDKRAELPSTLRIDDVPTVRSMVTQKLREAIMSGTLKPGQRLVERELCEMTGVSRPSIREALRLLEADGLVNTVPHRGPVVSTISLDEARQLYAARAVLEGFAGRECRAGGSDRACGSKAHRRMDHLAEVTGRIELAIWADTLRLHGIEPTAELERLFTETLDLCSHRLDAWVTSLATQRLAAMREGNPTGIYVGAFGWLEDLRPAEAAQLQTVTLSDGQTVRISGANDGYIHAPSMTHAAAAAVLRNGYRTRNRQQGERTSTNQHRRRGAQPPLGKRQKRRGEQ